MPTAASCSPSGSAAGRAARPSSPRRFATTSPRRDLLSYLEAILRVYNLQGRRDNKYKARIKILVHEIGAEAFARDVEEEWQRIRDGALKLPAEEIRRIEAYFAPPAFESRPAKASLRAPDRAFDRWVTRNTHAHRQPGYSIVTISLKPIGGIPGDASAEQMDAVADLAERYSFDEVRVTHEQNLVLPHVRLSDLWEVYQALKRAGLAEANAGLATDIIACPGLDYCALANARSIPIAQRISERLAARQDTIGDLKIKISGCINACGHHHVGHIGILGVEKRGEEHYQLLLGGSGAEDATLASITGPGFGPDGIVDAVEKVVDRYLELRAGPDEPFLAAYGRLGPAPFKEALYACSLPLPCATRLPLPVYGERVGVRGSGMLQRRRKLLPLTLTLSPRKSGERETAQSGATAPSIPTPGSRPRTGSRCPTRPSSSHASAGFPSATPLPAARRRSPCASKPARPSPTSLPTCRGSR